MAADPITAVSDLLNTVVGRIWPDKTEQDKARAAIEQMRETGQLQRDIAQLSVNQAEAATGKVFIAGWRPLIGWVCGLAFAWAYVLQPALSFLLKAAGHPVDMPPPELAAMFPVLLGMLGMGKLRTDEKIAGAEGNR